MTKKVYNYSPDSGLFTAPTLADESPLEPGTYLIPAFATEIEPPPTGPREAAIFKDGEWSVVPDWRGANLYRTADGGLSTIDAVGLTPDGGGLTEIEPPRPGERESVVFKDGAWFLVSDWRGVELYSTADGSAVVISESGQTPDDVGATDKPMPSAAHSWSGSAWELDDVKVQRLFVDAKARALSAIDGFHAKVVQQLVGDPTQVEKDTWALKLEAANAISSQVPLSVAGQAFLNAAGITAEAEKQEWAMAVLKKSAAYAGIVGLAEGLRARAKAAVRDASNLDEVQLAIEDQRAAADAAVAALLGR